MEAIVRRAHEEDRPPTRLVPTLALAAFVNMTGALALGPFLPVIAAELGTGVAVLGQVPALAMVLAAALGMAHWLPEAEAELAAVTTSAGTSSG